MAQDDITASQHIDSRIAELDDWRGETLARIREVIKRADPELVEEWKWRGVPVWSHAGMICTGETYKNVVKLTFPKVRRCRIRPDCSIPVLMGTPAVRSIFTRRRN